MKYQTVSVIIPAYNEEECLPACLDSLFGLDYPRDRLEVIVVDNGSEDRTREIARSRGAKLLRDDSMNVSGLRNLGSRESEGRILAFVDADCVVPRDWLMNAAKYFDETEVVAWGSPPVIPEKATWVQRAWFLVRRREKSVQETEWLESMNLFVRKEQFVEVGGFDDGLTTCEDVDFSYRIRAHGRIMSDSGIRMIHLGEAATLMEFVKKELWRGQSNFEGLRAHGFSLKELPSLSVPLYFGIFLPLMLILGTLLRGTDMLGVFFLLYLLPSVLVLLKVMKKKPSPASLPGLLFLLQFYFFSRTLAILKQ